MSCLLYHATPTSCVAGILREGLQPVHGGMDPVVHLSCDDRSSFIYGLFDLRPGGFWEFNHGTPDTVTLLQVDVTGLVMEHPGHDGEGHFMVRGPIQPGRISVVGEYTYDQDDRRTTV